MKFKFIMFSSIIFFLLTACDSAEKLVEKGINEMPVDNNYGIYDEKALEYFEKAIRKDSTCAEPYLQKGKINLKSGWDNCKDDFYKCTELEPDNVEAWKLLLWKKAIMNKIKRSQLLLKL